MIGKHYITGVYRLASIIEISPNLPELICCSLITKE
jgi:hypothetical protein